MAPTNRGVAKQPQSQRQTAATPVFNHDGTNIVITPQSNRSSFASLNIPNVPPGVTRHDIESPFTQFTQQQSFGLGMGVNPMGFNHQQQFSDPLSSAPTPSPTPGPNGFQNGYYPFANNMRTMGPQGSNTSNFFSNGSGSHHPGSLGPMFNNNGMQMQSQEPFGSQSMQQQNQYSMNYNMGYGFPGQQPQPFNVQNNNMYNNMSFNQSSSGDFSSSTYEPPSTSSSDTPPDRDFNGDAGMDVEFDLDASDILQGGSYVLSPTTEMLTSPSSDRMSGENGMDTVVKGEDFGSSSALSPPVLGEAKSSGTPTLNKSSALTSKPSLPSSKEKEQNKQKLYRNRKSEFTNKMRDELLGMGMLPSTRVTHAPEIMSKTADTLRDYRELLELIQNKIEGMPTNIAAVPGAVKKLLNENGNVFNNLRVPQVPQSQQTPAQPQQQQQAPTHTFKPDIKVPLGTTMNTTNASLAGRVTRSGAHVF